MAAAERALETGDLKTAGGKAAALAELDVTRATDLRRQIERKAGARDTNQRYAEAKVERDQLLARNLTPGQGFAGKLKALEVRWTAAEAARQAQNWGEALSGYDGVLADCREIAGRETDREAASVKATAAKVAEKEADTANARADGWTLYDEGGRASSRAAMAFDSGDFAVAAAAWTEAQSKYVSAARRARQVQSWRTAKTQWETRLAAVPRGKAFLQQHGGASWQAVSKDATIGAASADDPTAGKAAYDRALAGLDGAVADAETAERRGLADASLAAARAAKAAGQWQTCFDQATQVLQIETETGGRAYSRAVVLDEVKALKNEAESNLTPSLTVEAVLAGGVAVAATLSDGQRTWTTPATLKLTEGQRYNYTASYSAPNTGSAPYGATTNRKYKPANLSLTADWRGPHTERVVMQEQKEPLPGEEMTVDLGVGVKLTLCWCPAGSFLMGSPADAADRGSGETQHRVTLTKGFWMGKYEVTQAQWERVMGSNPSRFTSAGASAPVEQVSWDDCQEFVRKVNTLVPGGAFRLPTEAEWEYACRAGTTGPYAGNLDDLGWYGGNSENTTHAVGRKKANAWNLYDMHGNVWEWCSDWFGEQYPSWGVTDPAGPGSGSGRVCRGGGWINDARFCRSAGRSRNVPGIRYYYLGLRLARSPP